MRMQFRLWRPVTLLFFLGMALVISASAGSAAEPFDGTYTGPAVLTKGNSAGVSRTFNAPIVVTDGHLTYQYGGYGTVKTDVAADGSFSGAMTTPLPGYRIPAYEQLKGKTDGTKIEADASNPSCTFHLPLQKRA